MKNNKIEITFPNILAGALLKFGKIDYLALKLIIDDLEKIDDIRLAFYGFEGFREYVSTYYNGIFTPSDGMNITDNNENYNKTYKEIYEEYRPPIIKSYFDTIDIDEFNKRKQTFFEEHKIKVVNEANVLIITDIEDEYEELINYGFKNVNWFKSIIRAERYFKKHPEELENYHIILRGRQKVQDCCQNQFLELNHMIANIKDINCMIEEKISSLVHIHLDGTKKLEKVSTCFSDKNSHTDYYITKKTYKDFYEELVKNAIINNILSLKREKLIPIVDYVNPKKLSIPNQRKKLKILFLINHMIEQYIYNLKDELGVEITFEQDNKLGFGKHVKYNLGDYDIIISSSMNSNNLLDMYEESTEQCKDTGRQLTMLTNYYIHTKQLFDENNYYKNVGAYVDFRYVFGGELKEKIIECPSKKMQSCEYDIYSQNDFYKIYKSIIEVAITKYSESLSKLGLEFEKLPYKTIEEYNKEFQLEIKRERINSNKNKIAIQKFDDMLSNIKTYLKLRKEYRVPIYIDGIDIEENENNIKISTTLNGLILASIIIPQSVSSDGIRLFSIQTLNKKGNLNNPENIGIYIKKFENIPDIPNRPNEKQNEAIEAIQKKIDKVLLPIIQNPSSNEIKSKRLKKS